MVLRVRDVFQLVQLKFRGRQLQEGLDQALGTISLLSLQLQLLQGWASSSG